MENIKKFMQNNKIKKMIESNQNLNNDQSSKEKTNREFGFELFESWDDNRIGQELIKCLIIYERPIESQQRACTQVEDALHEQQVQRRTEIVSLGDFFVYKCYTE